MAKDSDIQSLYDRWCAIKKKQISIYNDKEIEFPKLWENDEFKKIRNAVVKEAARLGIEDSRIEDEVDKEDIGDDDIQEDDKTEEVEEQESLESIAAMSAFNLFYRLARMVEDDAKHKIDGHNKTIVDSKERKELAIKKQRLGIKME